MPLGRIPRGDGRRGRKRETREATVATLTDRASAEFIAGLLREEGILTRVVSTTGVEPSWTVGSPTAVNAVRIVVLESHAEAARSVLASVVPADEVADGPDGLG